MTEKRFKLKKDTEWWFVSDNTIQVNEFGFREDLTGEDKYRGLQQDLTEQETVDLLNKLYEENEQLHEENQQCKEYNAKLYSNSMKSEKQLLKQIKELEEENKQLQERNNRQAKQLDDLYRLIEQKDWRSLTDIMDDFQKAEKQLQSEWQTYCDDGND